MGPPGPPEKREPPSALGRAAPVTSTVRGIPSEVALTREDGLLHPSVANFDNLQLIGRGRLIRRVGTLSQAKLSDACRALRFALAC